MLPINYIFSSDDALARQMLSCREKEMQASRELLPHQLPSLSQKHLPRIYRKSIKIVGFFNLLKLATTVSLTSQ